MADNAEDVPETVNEQESEAVEEEVQNAVEVTDNNGVDADQESDVNTSEVKDEKEEEVVAEATEETVEDQDDEPADQGEEDAGDGDDDEEEDEEEKNEEKQDPNIMPQVNVAVLAKRRWQVKVFPLKPADFASGMISKVFKSARESLLYLMTGQYSRGKGEMYIQSVQESVKVVQSLMMLDSHFQEINIEVVRKNGEGAVQEKASMRFDTKMVRMLFVGPTNPFNNRNPGRGGYKMAGRRKERLIGSVFVKNLPPGTTKNMLRVMFPFAQEINYNPEKYTEGTARLVLKTRSTVIPCLKAFAKVELGGNILELHPLEKPAHLYEKNPAKKRSDQKSKNKSDKEGKGETDSTTEGKSSDDVKKETDSPSKADKKEGDSDDKKDGAKKNGDAKKPLVKKPGQQQKKPGQAGQVKNRPGVTGKNKDKFANSKDFGPRKTFGDNRMGLKKTGFHNPNRFTSMTGRSNYNSRSIAGGRGGRMMNVRRSNMGLGPSTELVQKAEATKDMMILQSQLNMAIKSQLAMLNQTQRAVQEAKRGASTLGLGSSGLGLGGSSAVNRSSLSHLTDRDDVGFVERRSRDRATHLDNSGSWGSYGGKRSAAQADLEDDYGLGGFSNKRSGMQRSAQYSQALAGQLARTGQQARAGQARAGQRARAGQQARGLQQVSRNAQSRALNNQRQALAKSRLREDLYDDDLYSQTSSLRGRMDDSYDNYSAAVRSYSSLNSQSTARSQLYDTDSYGYSRY